MTNGKLSKMMLLEELVIDVIHEHTKIDVVHEICKGENTGCNVPIEKVYEIAKSCAKKWETLNELTAHDIDIIDNIISTVDRQHCDNRYEFCDEVRRRFKEIKK